MSGTQDEQEMMGRIIVVLVNPHQMFMIGGIAPLADWDSFSATFEAVKESVVFFDPVVEESNPPTDLQPQIEEIRQWALFAVASSSYDFDDYGAEQATGAPDTLVEACEDLPTAWASEAPDTLEWLELIYETPVIPTEINIIQTHSPDQVVKVEVVDENGALHEVYSAVPQDKWEECPYTLSIPVDVDFAVADIIITIDQSVIPTPWNEIDAVELVGYPVGEDVGGSLPETEGETTPSGDTLALQDPPVPSNEATQVNERLLELGYEICYAESYFSPQTESAVKTFQQTNHLPVDGVVDTATWDRLFSEAALPYDLSVYKMKFSMPLEGIQGDKIASSGPLLWVMGRYYNLVEAYDTETGELAGMFSVTVEDGYTLQSMAYDGKNLWFASQDDQGNAHLQVYNLNVNPVDGYLNPSKPEPIRFEDVAFIRNLNYDRGRLWFSYEGTKIPSALAEIDAIGGEVLQEIEFGLDEYPNTPVSDGQNLWVAVAGGAGGYAIRSFVALTHEMGDPMGICGTQLAWDGAGLWVAKEDAVWMVFPSTAFVNAVAEFDVNIKDITIYEARLYILFEDDTVRYIQLY